MVKIGFIDYYLDEWHANNYPAWIKEASEDEMQVSYCYGEIDAPGGLTNDQWAEKYGVELCATIDELIEKSDVLCVLAPNNPETHERLSEKALMSGKTTYIDKTFAPDLETAKRIFDLAEKYNTPCMTTSALRYAEEYEPINGEAIKSLASVGGGEPDVYMIHQIEPLVMLCGTKPTRVRNTLTPECPIYAVEFENGKKASLVCSKAYCSFMMTFNFEDGAAKFVTVKSDFFKNFIKNLCVFYKTGEVLIPHEQTLAVMAIREACLEAKGTPDTWVEVKRG
ncbi:MAG: Gfo/Idh/MocA family oxidoreductase [Oscillospiraceae bacterium]|nr:Gfo/Idh/MocA family oxidoreductase [Oscillospiraceae bacterium]